MGCERNEYCSYSLENMNELEVESGKLEVVGESYEQGWH